MEPVCRFCNTCDFKVNAVPVVIEHVEVIDKCGIFLLNRDLNSHDDALESLCF